MGGGKVTLRSAALSRKVRSSRVITVRSDSPPSGSSSSCGSVSPPSSVSPVRPVRSSTRSRGRLGGTDCSADTAVGGGSGGCKGGGRASTGGGVGNVGSGGGRGGGGGGASAKCQGLACAASSPSTERGGRAASSPLPSPRATPPTAIDVVVSSPNRSSSTSGGRKIGRIACGTGDGAKGDGRGPLRIGGGSRGSSENRDPVEYITEGGEFRGGGASDNHDNGIAAGVEDRTWRIRLQRVYALLATMAGFYRRSVEPAAVDAPGLVANDSCNEDDGAAGLV